MCVAALPVLGAVLSIAQAGAGYAAASQQADEQNAYFEQNRRAAVVAMTDRYASLNNNTLSERTKASAELFQKRIEATRARAKQAVAAGEAGVTGLSVEALYADMEAQEARQEFAILTNYETAKQRNVDEGVATWHNAISRINSVRQASKPSALPFILQGLGGAVGAFGRGGAT